MDVQAIIDKYGPTLWAAAQRQVQIDIVSAFIWAGIAAVVIAVNYIIAIHFWKKWGREEDGYSSRESADTVDKVMFWGLASVLPLLFSIVFLCNLSTALNDIINPTYAAYQHLLPPAPD